MLLGSRLLPVAATRCGGPCGPFPPLASHFARHPGHHLVALVVQQALALRVGAVPLVKRLLCVLCGPHTVRDLHAGAGRRVPLGQRVRPASSPDQVPTTATAPAATSAGGWGRLCQRELRGRPGNGRTPRTATFLCTPLLLLLLVTLLPVLSHNADRACSHALAHPVDALHLDADSKAPVARIAPHEHIAAIGHGRSMHWARTHRHHAFSAQRANGEGGEEPLGLQRARGGARRAQWPCPAAAARGLARTTAGLVTPSLRMATSWSIPRKASPLPPHA